MDGYNRKLYYEFSVEYNRSFGSHNVTALALMNRQVSDSKDDKVIKFPSYREEWVGRVTYNWKERYLAEMNISYTGSENLPEDNASACSLPILWDGVLQKNLL